MSQQSNRGSKFLAKSFFGFRRIPSSLGTSMIRERIGFGSFGRFYQLHQFRIVLKLLWNKLRALGRFRLFS